MNSNGNRAQSTVSGHWLDMVLAPLINGGGSAEVVFDHRGPVDSSVLQELLGKAEASSVGVGDGVGLRKRLFNVLVEGLENVHHHTLGNARGTAIAVLLDQPNGYRLLLGNALPAATAAQLAHRVEVLNQMDEADMREHFLKLLSNDGRTGHGGAGLGLITMARKSTRPMIAHVLPRDEQTAYFALELCVLRG